LPGRDLFPVYFRASLIPCSFEKELSHKALNPTKRFLQVIIILKRNTSDADIQTVSAKLQEHGYQSHVTKGVEDTIIAALGAPSLQEKELVAPQLQALDAVERVLFPIRWFRAKATPPTRSSKSANSPIQIK
jgi:hypothetical protein